MIILNYTKAQYLEKIAELEGYQGMLEQHLVRMEELREQISSFWDDENARKAYMTLVKECSDVRYAMEMTHNLLTVYRRVVEEMDGVNVSLDDLLEGALSAVAGLGI